MPRRRRALQTIRGGQRKKRQRGRGKRTRQTYRGGLTLSMVEDIMKSLVAWQ